ncbi:hypothetical protein [Loktanella sp. M215]|uniref:hypothetical protein n=1 Tax=Loktanella sp. M215 TaxID=2675431 RepID=UPI001F405772|nr:hypothetical protein [Loktanella sp. M215]MCF7700528.1 hypothetical protein [Loktanella sp. M215]
MSCRKFSARSKKADTLTYRQQFAATWSLFVRANFDSAAEVATIFRVDPSTAENWWTGSNAPQGWVVARAMTDPDLRDADWSAFGGH